MELFRLLNQRIVIKKRTMIAKKISIYLIVMKEDKRPLNENYGLSRVSNKIKLIWENSLKKTVISKFF